jgi:transcriptional regulator with XRE-family HTH domain
MLHLHCVYPLGAFYIMDMHYAIPQYREYALGMKELGAVIKRQRDLRGWSGAELGRRLGGKHQSYVSRLEAGPKEMLPPEVINQLADVLDVPVAELLRAAGYALPAPNGAAPAGREDEAAIIERQPVLDDLRLGILRGIVETMAQQAAADTP